MNLKLCRVLVNNEDILNGLPLPIGAELVKIVPAYDVMGECHWLFLTHESNEEVPKNGTVPERLIIVTVNRIDSPEQHTVIYQREARFA